MSEHEDSGPPPFDEAAARLHIGKRVLIGITYVDSSGNIVRREQMYGMIDSVSAKAGISVGLQGPHAGETKWFPPDVRSLQAAPKGEYRLKETGEVVVDPDLLWTWNVSQNS